MLKVVVFDSGWGGEMFADYLEEQIPVVEVTRIIDWREAPYSEKGRTNICILADRALKPYIGKVDLIVLASFAVTVAAMSYLKWKYPEQKFVGFEMGLSDYVVGARKDGAVMALATGVVAESISYERELMMMSNYNVIRPDCAGWIRKVDDGEMTEQALRAELATYIGMNVQTILLYSTGFADLEPALKNIYGKNVKIIDDFARVAHKVRTMLGLGDCHRIWSANRSKEEMVDLVGYVY